jgi:hypothetical protein
MSELLLQTIVEKLGMLESLLKQVVAGKDATNQSEWIVQLQAFRTDIKKMMEQFLLNQEKMNELELKMEALEIRLRQPLKNQIEHKHHLHKGIWLAIVLSIVSIFFFYQWMSTNDDTKQFEANDIKYRALKVTGDRALLKLLYHTDSLYNVDAKHMRQWVVQEEDHFAHKVKMLSLAGEKEKETKDLKGRAEKK